MHGLYEVPNARSNATIPDPKRRSLPTTGSSQAPPRTPITIIPGTGKATDFKFGQYINRVHPNKNPLKFWTKKERGRIQGLPNFGCSPNTLGNGRTTDFKFCTLIYRTNRYKSPIKSSGKLAVGVVRDSRNFRGTHRIRRIARSSLR